MEHRLASHPKSTCSHHIEYSSNLRMPVSDIGLLASISISSAAGFILGFVTGLVPGLHVNNVAAAVVAYAGTMLGCFAIMGDFLGCDAPGLLISCFLVSALVSHSFSEAVPNTYVGIPASDAVSVLPAHRLAKAGLGWLAIRSSMDGSMAGVLLATIMIVPVCLCMGPWIGVYSALKTVMGFLIILFSVVLVLSDRGSNDPISGGVGERTKVAMIASGIFITSGLLGMVVLESDYFFSDLSPLPFGSEPIPSSSLLLPLFAGLFGIPTLLLSLSQEEGAYVEMERGIKLSPETYRSESLLTVFGGLLVGWIPGMTSGSSTTLCAVIARKPLGEGCGVDASRRFIWLYSAISSAGAVLSIGALFVILRARSGIMDAVTVFLGEIDPFDGEMGDLVAPCALILSMILSAIVSHSLMQSMRGVLKRGAKHLLSKRLTIICILFICILAAALTGFRGMLLMFAACSLGLLPPRLGVRRIHLMGCLLVPISISFLIG